MRAPAIDDEPPPIDPPSQPDRPRTNHHGEPLEWAKAEQIPGLPSIKLYRATNTRYPRSKIVDEGRDRELEAVDANVMNELVADTGASVGSAGKAKKLAHAFLILHYPRYRAKNISLRARKEDDVFIVTGTYERTQVWAPPEMPMIAGSRTAEYGIELVFTPEGELTVVKDEELRELRTSPSRSK